MSLTTLIKRLRDIMHKDPGVDGDAQRLNQIVWLIFLKVFDYKEEEAELDDGYIPVIPEGYRWRDWAVGTSAKDQMTGPDLLNFINKKSCKIGITKKQSYNYKFRFNLFICQHILSL